MKKQKYEYKLKDFYTASVLRSLSIPLVRVDKTYSICTFVLDIASEEARALIDNYWNKNLKVDARTLIEAINELKTRIHAS